MSLKARNTLRKIDVVMLKENKDPTGLFTFDISYTAYDKEQVMNVDYEYGQLIKLSQYESINV